METPFFCLRDGVSWELASKSESGIPEPVGKLFREGNYGDPCLIFAVAEHKVDLPGGNAASQCDVWGVVKTEKAGFLSLTVEAKAKEKFGDKIVEKWLIEGRSKKSRENRKVRLQYICSYLPESVSFSKVRYQILHRCAASVIEAKRLRFQHAAFVVQAFHSPDESFQDYAVFCQALKIPAARGHMHMATTSVDGISLSVGWADCLFATDAEVAATA